MRLATLRQEHAPGEGALTVYRPARLRLATLRQLAGEIVVTLPVPSSSPYEAGYITALSTLTPREPATARRPACTRKADHVAARFPSAGRRDTAQSSSPLQTGHIAESRRLARHRGSPLSCSLLAAGHIAEPGSTPAFRRRVAVVQPDQGWPHLRRPYRCGGRDVWGRRAACTWLATLQHRAAPPFDNVSGRRSARTRLATFRHAEGRRGTLTPPTSSSLCMAGHIAAWSPTLRGDLAPARRPACTWLATFRPVLAGTAREGTAQSSSLYVAGHIAA